MKTPKIYFTDTGLLCHLTGLRDPEHAAAGPLSGGIVETAVVSEIIKSAVHRGIDPRVYFWRTSHGAEVDIVIEESGRLIPVEVKQTSTPRPAMASGLVKFMNDYPKKVNKRWLVHLGSGTLPLAPGVTAVPYTEI